MLRAERVIAFRAVSEGYVVREYQVTKSRVIQSGKAEPIFSSHDGNWRDKVTSYGKARERCRLGLDSLEETFSEKEKEVI